MSWASGSASTNRLRDWLDPLNTGVASLAGADPAMRAIIMPASSTLVLEGCAPTNGAVDPGETVGISFGLQNIGLLATTNLVATLQSTGGVTFPSGPQTYGVVPAGGTVAQVFSLTATGACGGTLTAVLALRDGTNDLGTATFTMPLGTVAGFLETFDAATPPGLPAKWASSPAGSWVSSTGQRDTLPNSAYAEDVNSVTDQQLISPAIPIPLSPPQLTFRHSYDTEAGFDGGVLEIAINGGSFVDVLDAGGSFASNGYDDIIDTGYGNPLAGRSAWSGNSAGFISTALSLPPSAWGQNVQFRWRLGTDNSTGAGGWYVDTIKLSSGYNCCTGLPPVLLSGAIYNQAQHKMQFTVTGLGGASYVVQTSTNLSNWVALRTNVSPFTFAETNPPSPRYYRAKYQQ